MDNRHEKIRIKAYEVWERQGRTGDPEDHWYQAERELKAEETSTDTSQGRSEATVEEAPPVKAVQALEKTTGSPAPSKGSRPQSKG